MADSDIVDREIRWTRGRVLGEAVWRTICAKAGLDPKDETLHQRRDNLVAAVQGATAVMEESGFEGLEDWLKMEEEFR